MRAKVPKVVEASHPSSAQDQRRAASATLATDEQEDYLGAWQNVDSKEGVPLAVARKGFGNDPTCRAEVQRRRKPIIEELNEVLVA